MPHRTQQQIIKRRLTGKEGSARERELRAILDDLPNYRNGPYADLRKWVHEQIAETRQRGRVLHRDSIAVRREGAAQVALVGPPNAGKSSLLQALSAIQIKTGDYAFTTIRPVAALARIEGVLIQLVEIPGLIQGASADRGGGRALLGVLRSADAVVLCHEAAAPLDDLRAIRAELAAAGIDLPARLALTKADEAPEGAVERARHSLADLGPVPVSILHDPSLDRLRQAIWQLTGLIRIFLRHPGDDAADPVAVQPPASVLTVADTVHHDLARRCTGARVWGPSAKFPGQLVGREHELADGDTVEIEG
jgi:small GTP-binding protein